MSPSGETLITNGLVFFAHLAIGLIVTLTFLQLDNSVQSLQYRVFAIFFATVLPALILAQIEPQYIMSRMTFNVSSSISVNSQFRLK